MNVFSRIFRFSYISKVAGGISWTRSFCHGQSEVIFEENNLRPGTVFV